MDRLVPLLLFVVLSVACTTRVVYVPPLVAASTGAVNINTATAEDLERLPSIGPKTAESIIQFRDENGPFRRVEHVMLVRGVSERRFVEIRPHLRTE